jgi:hypothetical protein
MTTVRVRMIAEYDVEYPDGYDSDEHILFHRNDGTWCADSALGELQNVIEGQGCLCGAVRYEIVRNPS